MININLVMMFLIFSQQGEDKAAAPKFPEKEVRLLVQKSMEYWRVPGVAIAIVHQGETVFESGFGVVEISKKKTVDTNTLFPIASCTKAFTSALAASLVAKKKLDWDDKVQKHLPWFKLSEPLATEDCRLRDLFCHRTGLGSNDLLWYRSGVAPEENVRRAAFLPLEKPFRSAYQYQSIMYSAGGLVCEKAGNDGWGKLLKNEILDPLGMKETVVVPPNENLARGHFIGKFGFPEVKDPYVSPFPDPAGSVYSSAHDLANWLKFQVDPANQKYSQMAFASQLLETQKPQVVNPLDDLNKLMHPFTVQMAYGLGWVIQDYRGIKLISHGGAIDGFRTHIAMVPEAKFGLVILSSLEHTRMNLALSNSLVDLLFNFSQVEWDKNYAFILADGLQKSKIAFDNNLVDLLKKYPGSFNLADVLGQYQNPAYGKIEIKMQGKNVRLVLGNHFVDLDSLGSSILYARDFVFENPTLIFSRDSSAKISSFKISGRINAEFLKIP
ncbi:MAG: class A beta-lactamase-related serine hydrolase [Planctomycetes bacterium]|nr:class A beta-lactamase-related serine hydrolase [Planctomycetota bacterium]NBY01948.1 class A beta-lactamase-related serine hydrolase [Planctomycetota bacterium]